MERMIVFICLLALSGHSLAARSLLASCDNPRPTECYKWSTNDFGCNVEGRTYIGQIEGDGLSIETTSRPFVCTVGADGKPTAACNALVDSYTEVPASSRTASKGFLAASCFTLPEESKCSAPQGCKLTTTALECDVGSNTVLQCFRTSTFRDQTAVTCRYSMDMDCAVNAGDVACPFAELPESMTPITGALGLIVANMCPTVDPSGPVPNYEGSCAEPISQYCLEWDGGAFTCALPQGLLGCETVSADKTTCSFDSLHMVGQVGNDGKVSADIKNALANVELPGGVENHFRAMLDNWCPNGVCPKPGGCPQWTGAQMLCKAGDYSIKCNVGLPLSGLDAVVCSVEYPDVDCPIEDGKVVCAPGSFDKIPNLAGERAAFTTNAMCPNVAPPVAPVAPVVPPVVPATTATTDAECDALGLPRNEGTGNIGCGNNGNDNVGNFNNGSNNKGSNNQGSNNQGNCNIGSNNVGDGHVGSNNSGGSGANVACRTAV